MNLSPDASSTVKALTWARATGTVSSVNVETVRGLADLLEHRQSFQMVRGVHPPCALLSAID